jgi:galactofuranosylgalactofuranosylrhamnosyl-N-acetylglucosaminyl-diphospho-decaprenol beta-1,5/1,6-galactofuranosyltransferase
VTQTQPVTTSTSESAAPTTTRLLQRQVLPLDRDLDVLPLYVDTQPAILDADKYEVGANRNAREMNAAAMRQSISTGASIHPEQIVSRTAVRVVSGDRLSLGTYFNAFPASYWRRHTVVSDVTLSVDVEGEGATVTVYKSMANGRSQRVDSATVEGAGRETFAFELSLKPFVDGGWYWYDVIAGDVDVVVHGAEWTAQVPADRAQHGTTDICITTMNRPDFCAKLLAQIGDDEVLAPYLDTVFVMEQGTQKVVDSEEFPRAEELLGQRLRVVEQGNLGGSGGSARGQLESLRKGTATYAMMMDDDVVCEPEGILRAVTFGDLCRRPTIVGGHMFSLYAKSRLHSLGEIVTPWRFWWQSAPGVFTDWDFSARNLRSARWLHQRIDVDFNGWFMCLIPRQVIAEIGLSLPLFLKWDDSEYGLRAKKAGYPTVSFPGAAVWHVPWTDKNDALDWQAYFHHRNRLVAALLHSPYPKGGRMVQESLNHAIAHLVSMQYSTVEIRHQAILDVLEGPDALHAMLPTKLSEVNAFRKQFTDARLETDRDAFPEVKRTKPPRKGRDDTGVPKGWETKLNAALMPLRQLRKPRPLAQAYPEAEIRAMDAKWYRLGRYDSAVVSMNDGTSAALYQRDPDRFRDLMKRTVAIHARLRREWPELAQQYRDRLGHITSPEAWDETFRPWTEGDGAEEPDAGRGASA